MSKNVFKIDMELLFPDLRRVLIITATSIIIYALSYQSGMADWITCSRDSTECNGTEGDDSIWGRSIGVTNINGLEGNDYIICNALDPAVTCNISGGDGNDTLIGARGNDKLFGGRGNDKYDGGYGDDTVFEWNGLLEDLVSNDDIISGGPGNDVLSSGEGADAIHAGPGTDQIYSSPNFRDFSRDIVDCGPAGDYVFIYSGDGDVATNCENIDNSD